MANLNLLHDTARWSEPLERTIGFRMLDPVTGRPIDTQAPPAWMLQERQLARGYAHLGRVASRLTVLMGYSRHTRAEDFGPIDQGWYEQQMTTSDIRILEAHGWTAKDRQDAQSRARRALELTRQRHGDNHTYEDYWRVGRRSVYKSDDQRLQARVERALALSDAPFIYADVAKDGTEVERRLFAFGERVRGKNYMYPPYAGYMNYREWVMLCRLGLGLEEIGLRGNRTLFWMVGAGHQDLTRKLALRGIKATPVGPFEKVRRETGIYYVDVFPTGIADTGIKLK